MTDPTTLPAAVTTLALPPVDPFTKVLVTSLAQKGLTMLFMALVAHGWFAADSQSAFVEIGLGVAAGIASFAWTWIHARDTHGKFEAGTAAANVALKVAKIVIEARTAPAAAPAAVAPPLPAAAPTLPPAPATPPFDQVIGPPS